MRQVGDGADCGEHCRLEHDAEPFVLVDHEEAPGRDAEGRLAVGDDSAAGAVRQSEPGHVPDRGDQRALLAGEGGGLDDRARPRLLERDAGAAEHLAVGAGLPDRLQRRELLNHACGSLPDRRNDG